MKKKIWIPLCGFASTLALAATAVGLVGAYETAAAVSKKDFTVHALFVDHNGQKLYETDVPVGDDVVYGGETPTREDGEGFHYVFSGWDKPLSSLTADTLFRAQYDVSYLSYTATFVNIDGTYLWSDTIRYGDAPVYAGPAPTYSTIDGVTYTWEGEWDKPLEPLSRDTTFVAKYKREDSRHRCTFYDADGNIIKTVFVVDGQAASAPEFPWTMVYSADGTDARGVTAYGWDHDLSNITADTDFHPLFPTYEDAVLEVYFDSDLDGYVLRGIYRLSTFLAGTALHLPSTYQNKPIVGVDSIFGEDMSQATRLVVPEGYQFISNCGNLTRLEAVELPSTLKRIGYRSFYGADYLNEITFPNGSNVEKIEEQAFAESGIHSFTVPSSIQYINYTAFDDTYLSSQKYEQNGATILPFGDGNVMITAITGLKDLFTAGVPSNCVGIHFEQYWEPNGSRRYTTSLTTINFGAATHFVDGPILNACIAYDVTVVVPSTMRYFSAGNYEQGSLKEFRFGGSMNDYFNVYFGQSVGKQNLYINGAQVTNVVVPSAVTEIPNGLFDGCSGVTSVTFHNNVKRIGDQAFANTSIQSLDLPNSLERIGYGAFRSTQISSVSIPNVGDGLCDDAFAYCYNLTSVTLAEGITRIPYYCFAYTGLTYVNIPTSVTFIGSMAFPSSAINFRGGLDQFLACENELNYDRDYYESWKYQLYLDGFSASIVTLPETVTAIRPYLFRNYTNIVEMRILGQLQYLGAQAFANCSALTTLEFPTTLKTFSGDAFEGCDNLQDLSFEGNPSFQVVDGSVYNHMGNVLLLANPHASGLYEVSSGVTEVGDGAFSLSREVTSLSVPSTVKMLGSRLIPGGELETVTLSDGLTVMAPYTFSSTSNNTKIEELHLPRTLRMMERALERTTITDLYIPASFGAAIASLDVGSPSVTNTYYAGTLDQFADEVKSRTNYWFGKLHCRSEDEYVACSWNDIVGYTSICDRGFEGAWFGGETDFVSSTIRSVGYDGLANTNLTSLKLSKLSYAAAYAFSDNSSLTVVDFRGSSLPYLSNDAFEYCHNLKNVYLNEGLRHLGMRSFAYDLWGDEGNTITLLAPSTLTYVDGQAFQSNVDVLLPKEGFDDAEALFQEASDYLASLQYPKQLRLIPYAEDETQATISWKYDANNIPVVTEN